MTLRRGRAVIFTIVAAAVAAVFMFPLFWMLLGSLKQAAVFLKYPPVWVFVPTLGNYRDVLANASFARDAINSAVVAFAATGLGLLLGVPASYAIARFKMEGVGTFILLSRMMPGISFLVPWFVMFVQLKLVGSYVALVVAHLILTLPLIVWMMVSFVDAVPPDIDAAATMDGCSQWSIVWRMIVPLTRQGIAATGILAFILSWNNFLFSVALSNTQTQTLPVAVFNFVNYESVNWGSLTAAATMITAPVLVLAIVVQRHIVQGLVAGAVGG